MGQVASTLPQVISDLRGWFDNVEVRRPPKSVEFLERVGAPDELMEFYTLCDGIRVASDADGDLYSLRQMTENFPVYHKEFDFYDQQVHGRLLPIRDDRCGDYDCVVMGDGPCSGAVVFWDHEIAESPAYLLAGSLSAYLRMWSDKLLTVWDRDGKRLPEATPPKLDAWPWLGEPLLKHPWPFDERWLRRNDPDADRILRDPRQRGWLARQGRPPRWTGVAGVVSGVRRWLAGGREG